MPWSVHGTIRAHREALGLSQADLAESLNVSNSHLSLIEAGKRQPTDEQIAILARVLRVPPDLLLLGGGRLPDDVRGAFAADAAQAVAAVRQCTEAHAIRYPSHPSFVPLPKSDFAPPLTARLTDRIDATKTSTSYRAHSYHTKMPPEAIRPLIGAFTRPGENVLDPFCGSGMTGVAALMEGRNALLSDLSPAAVHIARNYTTICDPKEFAAALGSVERAMAPTIAWLYRPVDSPGIVEYTTWSDIYRCSACQARIVFWEAARRSGVDGDRVACPTCSKSTRKADLEWIGEVPVESHTAKGSNRIDSHPPTREELALIAEAAASPIPYWIPQVSFGTDREMWRAGHRAMGITDVQGFFTKRNLHALAALRHEIIALSEGRVREALMFAFTAAVNRASRRYQWNAKRPTNVMTGTLYISSLRYEWNVWSLFRRKAADVLRHYECFPVTSASVEVFRRSATDLDCLPDGSIDMVFMDPPFGSNIFYGDSSLLWEAWLGELTDTSAEIVINKHRSPSSGGKTLQHYGELIERSFAEAARVLKRGGRAVLAFSNSDDQIWNAVQSALASAGFNTTSVHVLNKGQPSIKGVKGVTGKEHVTTLDLLMCLEHRSAMSAVAGRFPPPIGFVDEILREKLADLSAEAYRTDGIYSAVIRALIEANYSVSGITMPEIEARCLKLGAVETAGRWRLPRQVRDRGRQDFIEGYITAQESLPRGAGGRAVAKPLQRLRVAGGRNSALYLAHSYHTKVPPEAIQPFIEHFTKPGDVILDPFSGSGMTGVAATLSGRRAILNDLSPAAVHLAWNHTRPCDPQELADGFARLESAVADRFSELYHTTDVEGKPARIHWTLWSTRHRCPECRDRFQLWDVIDRTSGRLGRTIKCPNCKQTVGRSALTTEESLPAWIAGETQAGKRFEKAPSAQDVKRALSLCRESIQPWYPTTPLTTDREMYIRCALHLQGIESVADFYTPRNLEALALLWEHIVALPNERVRRALAFAFTNTAWHGTRMRRFNARGGQRPLTGTLYIPQLSSEANVLEVMRHKVASLQRYYRSFRPTNADVAIRLGSATHLQGIADGSIDYVFTDPPFGSNIFYADCNLIWESWLGRLTDVRDEAVVNRSLAEGNGGKSLAVYAELIGDSLREIARVLKPGGWATVVFHSTDAEVWQAISDAAMSAGFRFHEASSLDRLQQSHKGYKGRSGQEDVAHFDVVFNLRKPEKLLATRSRKASKPIDLSGIVATLAADPEVAKRGLQGVHAEVMRQLASKGHTAFVDYAAVRTIWERLRRPGALARD
jgi:DNA modification methylase/transcriptional regulator with XRE-family HTH domain/DNA-directed RNA polymerase subunit RPC12/RpoP